MKRLLIGFALGFTASICACKGGEGPGSGNKADDAPNDDGSDDEGGPAPPPPDSCQNADDRLVKDRALARLTPVQYRNTLATLLGKDRFRPPELPAQLPPAGFAFSTHIKSQVVNQPVVEAFSQSAYDASLVVAKHIDDFPPCADGKHKDCGKAFISGFGKRTFRRPLSDEEATRYGELFEGALSKYDYKTAVQMTAEAFLSAPQFLYQIYELEPEDGVARASDWQLASQLSFLLTNNMPDDELMQAAEAGDLQTAKGLRSHAKRLYESEAGRATMTEFLGEWLNVAALNGVSKDPTLFPDFGASDVEALRTSFLKTLEHNLAEAGTLAGLLTSRTFVLNAKLGPLVGLEGELPDDFSPVDLADKSLQSQRSGFLTHPAWLAVNAHDTIDAPVLRGLFVFERLLCQHVPPPPDDVPSLKPTEGKMTARMALEETHHVRGCVECHAAFDAFGFAFGHYDAVGRWRDTDSGFPVNAKVDLPEPLEAQVENAIELSELLAASPHVQRCLATQLFRRTFGRQEDENQDRCVIDSLASALNAKQGNISEMILSLVGSASFTTLHAPEAP
jgi:hypothetical protein